MKCTWKRARRLVRRIIGLISLIIWVLAPWATLISSAHKEPLAVDSWSGNGAPQGLSIKDAKAAQVAESFGNLPLRFEQNVGQFAKPAQFFCRGKGYDLALAGHEVVLKLEKAEERKRSVCEEVVGDCERLKLPHSAFCLAPSSSTVSLFGNPQPSESKNSGELQSSARISSSQTLPQAERSDKNVSTSPERSATNASFVSSTTATVKMKFIGGNAAPRLTGLDESPSKSHYFIGNNPKQLTGSRNRFDGYGFDKGVVLHIDGNSEPMINGSQALCRVKKRSGESNPLRWSCYRCETPTALSPSRSPSRDRKEVYECY